MHLGARGMSAAPILEVEATAIGNQTLVPGVAPITPRDRLAIRALRGSIGALARMASRSRGVIGTTPGTRVCSPMGVGSDARGSAPLMPRAPRCIRFPERTPRGNPLPCWLGSLP